MQNLYVHWCLRTPADKLHVNMVAAYGRTKLNLFFLYAVKGSDTPPIENA